MSRDLRSNHQIWGKDFPIGGEWDAGVANSLATGEPGGRWTVRRDPDQFVVVFHAFSTGAETVLEPFDPTEKGEIAAKACALAALENGRRSP